MMLAAMLALVAPMMAAAPAMALDLHDHEDRDGLNFGLFDHDDFFDFFGLER